MCFLFDLPNASGSSPGTNYNVHSTPEETLTRVFCKVTGQGDGAEATPGIPPRVVLTQKQVSLRTVERRQETCTVTTTAQNREPREMGCHLPANSAPRMLRSGPAAQVTRAQPGRPQEMVPRAPTMQLRGEASRDEPGPAPRPLPPSPLTARVDGSPLHTGHGCVWGCVCVCGEVCVW